MSDWTFFSNYGHVLVCLARDRDVRLRDVAARVGITERATQKIVRDLVDAGYLSVTRHGRCNRYRINRRKALRHRLQSQCTVGQLLRLLAGPESLPRASPDELAAVVGAEKSTAEPAPQRAEPSPELPQQISERKEGADVGQAAAESVWQRAEKTPGDKEEAPADDAALDTREQGSLF
ncbi:MAG: winged helix-turn-helix domain-containing protein [Xanthomonadales bacterium]|nr:winged helix-turn-helix domain-containing protein [Xanthomonadales bacterium]